MTEAANLAGRPEPLRGIDITPSPKRSVIPIVAGKNKSTTGWERWGPFVFVDMGRTFDRWNLFFLINGTLGGMLDIYLHFFGKVGTGEDFLTPGHWWMYGGFAGLVIRILMPPVRSVLYFIAYAVWCWWKGRENSLSFEIVVPRGYVWATIAVLIGPFGVFADSEWHKAFGVEGGVEVVTSPTHMVLVTCMITIAASIYSAEALRTAAGSRWKWRHQAAAIGAALSMAFFFWAFIYPYVSTVKNFQTYTPESFVKDVMNLPPEVGQYLLEHAYRLLAIVGFIVGWAGTIITSIGVLIPVHWMCFRYRIPPVLWTLYFVLMTAFHAIGLHKQPWSVGWALVIALIVEVAEFTWDYRRTRLRRMMASILLPVTVQAVTMLSATVYGHWWSPHVVPGTIMVAAVVGGIMWLWREPSRVTRPADWYTLHQEAAKATVDAAA